MAGVMPIRRPFVLTEEEPLPNRRGRGQGGQSALLDVGAMFQSGCFSHEPVLDVAAVLRKKEGRL